MFAINKSDNSISEIKKCSFHELGFKERENLQEWIAKSPNCFGEDLLIIQKEFNGFNDTNERLDLLALDQDGSLVIIENKLDDTGRDVVWQCLKYVSYCSTLTKAQIIEIYQDYLDKNAIKESAKNNISEFFDGKPLEEITLNENDQRMILVAANFRKEVTSTVMWMLNHSINVKCFKATPYQYNNNLFLTMEQIIPVKETADYIIQMADKAKEVQNDKEITKDIENIRMQYWTKLLEKFNNISPQYRNIKPTINHWLSSGAGVSGITFAFDATTWYCGVELIINYGSREENEKIFNNLLKNKKIIEGIFGGELVWNILGGKKSCRISTWIEGVNIRNTTDWDKMVDYQCEVMVRFEKALRDKVKEAAKNL